MSKQFITKLISSRNFLHFPSYFFLVFLCLSSITTPVFSGTPITGVVQLWSQTSGSGFGYHSCVIAAGKVRCWGNNAYGQLGNGSSANAVTPVDVVTNTVGPVLLSGISSISIGRTHSCALTTSGGVKCWGDNSKGQLGIGTLPTKSELPVDVSGLTSGVTSISAGYDHTCALLTDTTVKCWGYNLNTQIADDNPTWGSGTSADIVWTPVPIIADATPTTLTGVLSVSAGDAHTCAVMDTVPTTVKCWGWNTTNQLGIANATSFSQYSRLPIDVPSISDVTAVAAASGRTCVLLNTSPTTAKCWGQSSVARLGNNTSSSSNVLAPGGEILDASLAPLTGITALALGTPGCALLNTGGVKCWGANFMGSVGDGTTVNKLVAVDVIGLTSGVSAIAGGEYHFCALISGTGEVKCWGGNSSGTLGDASTTSRSSPVFVVLPGIPNDPSNLIATALSATQIRLTWTDNSGDETGFKIESPVGTLINTTAVNNSSTAIYNHTSLTCGTTYNYSVKATNALGDSNAITASATTQACSTTTTTSPTSPPSYTVIKKVDGDGVGSISETNIPVTTGQTAKIQLTAIPATGSKFIGWSNSFAPECVGSSPDVTVSVNAIKTCIATFEIIKQSGFRSSIMDTGALDFGNIPIAINRSFTISENGNIDLIISNPTLSGDNASDFKIITPQFPLTIPDGAPAQIITAQCKPSSEGTRTARLQFTTNDPQNPTVQYALNCNATSLDIGGAISVPTAKYSSLPVVNQAIMFGSALIGQ